MTETTNITTATKPKHRSPSYPAIDLKTAVGRAAQIERIAGTRPAPREVVVKDWGYTTKSSNGIVTVAALKKYGLTTEIGRGNTGKIQLTKLANEILFFDEGSEKWLELVRRAALTPRVYRELWKSYGPDLPDDSVMLHDLRFEKGFADAAARDVVRLFRATVAYVRLAEADGILDTDEGEDESDELSQEGARLTPPPSLAPEGRVQTRTPGSAESGSLTRSTTTVQITYAPTEWALLQAKFPMSEDDWAAMIAVLEAMKRGLVVSEPETRVPTSRTTAWNAEESEGPVEPAAPSEDP